MGSIIGGGNSFYSFTAEEKAEHDRISKLQDIAFNFVTKIIFYGIPVRAGKKSATDPMSPIWIEPQPELVEEVLANKKSENWALLHGAPTGIMIDSKCQIRILFTFSDLEYNLHIDDILKYNADQKEKELSVTGIAKCAIPLPPVLDTATTTSLSIKWFKSLPYPAGIILHVEVQYAQINTNNCNNGEDSEDEEEENTDKFKSGSPSSRKSPTKTTEQKLKWYALVSKSYHKTEFYSHELTHLTPGSTYAFRIRYRNDAEWSEFSPRSEGFSTLPDRPARPAPPQCTSITSNTINFEWQEHTRDNGAPITAYILKGRSVGDSFVELYHGMELSYLALGMYPEFAYSFQLAVVNEIGTSDYSTMVSVQLPQKINKMSGVSLPPMQGGFTQSQIILAMQCKDAWKECWDPKTEQMFYFNKIIATRQLEKPAVLCERERQEKEDKSSSDLAVVKTEKEILAEAEILFRKKRYRLLRALHKNKYNAINTSNSASRRSSGNINDTTNGDNSTVQSSLLYNGITVTSNSSSSSNNNNSGSNNSTLFTSQSTSVLSPNNTNKLKETLKLELRREYMLGDCFKVLHGLKLIDFYRRLKVEFVGEAGIDSGGLSKEAFLLLSKQAASYIGPGGRHWMQFIEGKIDTDSGGNGDAQQGLFFVSNSQLNAHNTKYNELCVARQKAGRSNATNTTNGINGTISANTKASNIKTTNKNTLIPKSTIPVEMCCDLDSILTLNSESFFRFLGKLLGKALFDRQLVDFPFSSLLLQHMLGGMSFERNMNANGTIKSPSQSPVKSKTIHNVNSNSGGNSSSTTAANSAHNSVSNINIGNSNGIGTGNSSDTDKQTSEVLSMLEEIKDIDTALYTQLKWIAGNNITDVIYETFSITETTNNSNSIVLPLCANGENRHVTEENKLEYIQLVLLYKTKYSVSSSLFPFLESFHEFIPLNILQQVEITKNELNLILNGKSTVDVEELRAYCMYQSDDEADFNETHDSIIFLWRLFREMSDEDRRILLKFFTGSSRVPLDGYDPPLSVTQGTDMRDDSLPRAHTCFNQLVLPNYTSYDICKEKIMFAMRNTEGFELS